MVQEFCVLKCHSCELFQVHIVKKAKTWNCKVCGRKQSVIKVFGQGSAKDCRIHVQKLNEQHALNSNNHNELPSSTLESGNEVFDRDNHILKDGNGNSNFGANNENKELLHQRLPNNKWQKYLESNKKKELPDNTQKFLALHYASSNCEQEQQDEFNKSVSKKLRLSLDETSMKKNGDAKVENKNSNSGKIFKFLTDYNELSAIDDILDI